MSFEFAPKKESYLESKNSDKWNILIVDDDKEVHNLTKMVFKKFTFEDKGINFEHAYSASEAKSILKGSDNLALILLDVVMEEIDSGLKLVPFIRDELKNDTVRIILRTGQPGVAPEEKIVRDYDINDYKSKSELSEMHLITTIISSLRSYSSLIRIKEEVAKNIAQEKKLTQQARTSAMGEMMGAIIHQWKQPLGTIGSIASNLKVQVALETINMDMVDEEMQKINNIIGHMVLTMNDFRDFFRPSKKEAYNVNSAIYSAISLVGKTYEAQGIKINLHDFKELRTEGYANELVQVILIILSNAHDAIIKANPKLKDIDISTKLENSTINIQIRDYAGGIENNILEKIFQPYFSTKAKDEGEGIGLDMSRTILKKVDGRINVENKETDNGRGACFIITLNQI